MSASISTPIRVGFIGLTSSPSQSLGGQWGASAHLPYLLKSPHYTITALCNSSVESAKKAIALHQLDESKVRAYGDPESLAKDGDVDLVVCCVKVYQHYSLCKPALLAGKMVFCEWPLASNLKQMNELATLAKEKKVKTVVGLQGRFGSYVKKIKDLVGEGPGQIGDVLSTTLTAYGFLLGLAMPASIEYLMNIDNGGNLFTITSIHLLDTLTATLGEIKTFNSLLANKRPTVALLNSDGTVANPAYHNTSHDHILLQGELSGGAVFNVNIRGGPPFKGTPGLDWRIYGSKGEIRVTCPRAGLWLDGDIKLEVYHFVTDSVEEVDLQKVLGVDDPGVGLQAPADNVARVYEAFAKGQTDKYLDFEQSLKWASFIDSVYASAGVHIQGN